MKKTLKQFTDFLENLLHDRFEDIQQINNNVVNFLGFNISFELKAQDNNDFQLLANFSLGKEKLDLYLDLYYILDRQEQLYLTEYSLDGEHPLSESDNQLVIVGVSR
jgi:hypothetical protein